MEERSTTLLNVNKAIEYFERELEKDIEGMILDIGNV